MPTVASGFPVMRALASGSPARFCTARAIRTISCCKRAQVRACTILLSSCRRRTTCTVRSMPPAISVSAPASNMVPVRHGFSHRLYLRDPDGHRIALLLPPIQVIDADDGPVRRDLQSGDEELWAPPPPRTWFEEATRFAGVAVTAPKTAGAPAIAGVDLFGGRLGFRGGRSFVSARRRSGFARSRRLIAFQVFLRRPGTTRSLCVTPRYFSSVAASVASVALSA